jgi:hypothetical protein
MGEVRYGTTENQNSDLVMMLSSYHRMGIQLRKLISLALKIDLVDVYIIAAPA